MDKTEIERLDSITRAVYSLLKGHPAESVLTEGWEKDEIHQLAEYINELISEIDSTGRSASALSSGNIYEDISGSLPISSSLKNLQATLRHITWQTQQVASGDFLQRVEFLGEFSESFNSMVEQLDRARKDLLEKENLLTQKNQDLDSFAYTVSHDLKTPLITIQGFVNIITEDYIALFDDNGRRYLSRISSSCEKMTCLINDLLDFSRIGRVEDTRTEIEFNSIAKEALNYIKPMLENRGVNVILKESSAVLFGEKTTLGQVFQNLISNAVKYIGENNPSPEIEIGIVKTGGETKCYVKDNGIGIAPENFDKIFGMYQRLPGTHNIEGTGVGLAIVKRIIQNHGGNVWVESKPGEGAAFFFTLKGKPAEISG